MALADGAGSSDEMAAAGSGNLLFAREAVEALGGFHQRQIGVLCDSQTGLPTFQSASLSKNPKKPPWPRCVENARAISRIVNEVVLSAESSVSFLIIVSFIVQE